VLALPIVNLMLCDFPHNAYTNNESDKSRTDITDINTAENTKQTLGRMTPQGIVLFRVLVRLKVFQLFGIAGISVVATTLLSGVRPHCVL